MTENENVSKNFIEQIIDKDIEEGHCSELQRSPDGCASASAGSGR